MKTRTFSIYREGGDLVQGELAYGWTYSKGVANLNITIFSITCGNSIHIIDIFYEIEKVLKDWFDVKLGHNFSYIDECLSIVIDNRPNVS